MADENAHNAAEAIDNQSQTSTTSENDIVTEVEHNEGCQDHNEICNEVLPQLRLKIGSLEINGRSLMIATRYAMELIELTKLKGEEQKQMVLHLLQHIVKDAPLSEKKEKLCLKLINGGIVGQTIDLIVDASRGNIQINQVAELAAQTLVETKCCGLFGN